MIPERVMRELRYIEVYTGKKIRNQLVGPYQSPLRGSGFDFDEHQPYRPGDDVRRIDWNVTARMAAPFVRHTHAEREMNIMIAMDVSRSMALGSSGYSKKEALTLITGSLLFSALSDQINTGLLAFDDRVRLVTQPKRTRAAAWSVLERCWSFESTSAGTALLPVVRYLVQSLKRMTVIFIVSDFMTDEDAFTAKDLSVLAARHDVIAVVPIDPAEAELPPGRGYVTLRDLESGRRRTVGLSDAVRAQYALEVRGRREALTKAFYRVPMEHVFVPTDRSPVEPLMALFARRITT